VICRLSGDLDFKELPELMVQHEGLSEKFNEMPFTGDPAKVLVNVEGEGDGEGQEPPQAEEGQAESKPVDEDEEELKKVPKKNFTELSRLSYVVRAVENDVQCVPKDSYRVTP
jgi:radial spoke head protein 9